MEKHFVKFYSPGVLFSEISTLPIDSWDVNKAIEMSYSIKERHGATPYAFRFITRGCSNEVDSKIIKQSNMYYLGGEVYTLQEIIDRNDPNDRILIDNMKHNNYDRVICNCNSYKWTAPLERGDVVLYYNPREKDKGII
jgi:hypothetical protein